MNRPILLVATLLAYFAAAIPVHAQAPDPIEPRREWFRALDIEPAVAQAELILVTRIEEIREIPLPVGGKGERAMLQIRFKPMRVLKGVFAREALTLTNYDLGISQSRAGLEQLKAGDLRLLFLGRSQVGYQNRNVAADVNRSLPFLRDAQDPLTASVSTLLAVCAESDRARRVKLLTEALALARGAAAVPLLNAIPRRSLLAAQQDATLTAIAPHLTDASPSVRIAAGDALRAVLAADYLEQPDLRGQAASALGAALRLDQPNAAARIALLGAASELASTDPDLIPSLAPESLFTIQRAQIQALGKSRSGYGEFRATLVSLPLDHPNADAYEMALARLEPEVAAKLTPQRARQKLAAGLSIESEIHSTTPMSLEHAVAALIQFAELPLNAQERLAFAMAARSIAARSPRQTALQPLVSPLATMLDPNEGQTRYVVVAALVDIDTPAAAQVLQPHLREETNLSQKLLMAEFLGRHGIRDGYPYAIEHMSEAYLLEQATAALAAIGEPRAIMESRRILETSNDVAWNTAAIRTLGAMGERSMAPQFLEITKDWSNPLAPAALIALGDLGESRALPAAREGLDSRSAEIVIASARSGGSLIKKSGHAAAEFRDALATLLADSSATEPMRAAALEALIMIEDPRIHTALAAAVADAGLEGTSLQGRAEELMRERKVRLPALPGAPKGDATL
jgi:hypothetical protein